MIGWRVMQHEISLSSDPVETARSLIKNNGLTRAMEIAIAGTATANEEGNFYQLSVWREVKGILRKGAEKGA